jgi:hypothetical protein
MKSSDSVPKSAVLDQDEVLVGEALELGSRCDNDEDEDDCSCRTDMAIMRASTSNIYILAEEVLERRNIDDREGIIMIFQRFSNPSVGRGEELLSNGYGLDDGLSESLLSLDVASRRQLVTELHNINIFRSLAEELLGRRKFDYGDSDLLIQSFERFINPTVGRGEDVLSRYISFSRYISNGVAIDDGLRERLLSLDVASRRELVTQLEWACRERRLHATDANTNASSPVSNISDRAGSGFARVQGTALGPANTSSDEAASDATEADPLGVNPNSGILRYGGNIIANPNSPRQNAEADFQVLAQGSLSSAPTGAAAIAHADQSQDRGLVTLAADTVQSTATAGMDGINKLEDSEDRKRKTPGDSAESSPDSEC